MTIATARCLLAIAAVLTATAASAQVTVKPVRASRVPAPAPVLGPAQQRLSTTTVRPTVTRPATDTYRNDTRALQLAISQQNRPSLAAVAQATKKPASPQSAPIGVRPPLGSLSQTRK
jgi:hypothetical protein